MGIMNFTLSDGVLNETSCHIDPQAAINDFVNFAKSFPIVAERLHAIAKFYLDKELDSSLITGLDMAVDMTNGIAATAANIFYQMSANRPYDAMVEKEVTSNIKLIRSNREAISNMSASITIDVDRSVYSENSRHINSTLNSMVDFMGMVSTRDIFRETTASMKNATHDDYMEALYNVDKSQITIIASRVNSTTANEITWLADDVYQNIEHPVRWESDTASPGRRRAVMIKRVLYDALISGEAIDNDTLMGYVQAVVSYIYLTCYSIQAGIDSFVIDKNKADGNISLLREVVKKFSLSSE